MFSTTCTRCGKAIMSSTETALCRACQSRKANGKRLAAENHERREWESDEERKYARIEYASLFDVPLADVPPYVGTDADPLYNPKG